MDFKKGDTVVVRGANENADILGVVLDVENDRVTVFDPFGTIPTLSDEFDPSELEWINQDEYRDAVAKKIWKSNQVEGEF